MNSSCFDDGNASVSTAVGTQRSQGAGLFSAMSSKLGLSAETLSIIQAKESLQNERRARAEEAIKSQEKMKHKEQLWTTYQ